MAINFPDSPSTNDTYTVDAITWVYDGAKWTLSGAAFQPLDADLTAIAALTTTSYGRAFLALADTAAARTATVTPLSAEITTIKQMTAAAYAALGSKDSATLYVIVD